MKRRAFVFWPLLVAFTALCLAWLFYVPRQVGLLHRAIPAAADYVSAHRGVAGRWDRLVAHPLVQAVAVSLGTERGELDKMGANTDFRRILDKVGADELLLAHVPIMRSTGEPAWVFAAWLGGESQRLRWLLKSIKVPELKRAATRNGWMVWVWAPRELKGQRVTFALVEGMLVGCVAHQTLGIDDLLAGIDGHAVTLADRPALYLPLDGPSLDRGWYRDRRGQLFSFDLTLDDRGSVRASVETPWSLTPRAAVTNTPGMEGLKGFSGLAGSHSVAVAAVDRELVRSWMAGSFTNALARELVGLLGLSAGSGPVALGLLGGDYSGRFMAVRLPTLVATAAGSPDAQSQFLLAAMDRLNKATRWGLVSAPLLVDSTPVHVIEATGNSWYAGLEREELLAYTPVEDGLVFSSNLATLKRLVRNDSATNTVVWAGRLAELGDGKTIGFLWFEAAEGAKVVRLGVTAWSLKLLLEDAQGSQATRQRMNELKAWIDALAPLGRIYLGLEDRSGKAYLTVEAGAP